MNISALDEQIVKLDKKGSVQSSCFIDESVNFDSLLVEPKPKSSSKIPMVKADIKRCFSSSKIKSMNKTVKSNLSNEIYEKNNKKKELNKTINQLQKFEKLKKEEKLNPEDNKNLRTNSKNNFSKKSGKLLNENDNKIVLTKQNNKTITKQTHLTKTIIPKIITNPDNKLSIKKKKSVSSLNGTITKNQSQNHCSSQTIVKTFTAATNNEKSKVLNLTSKVFSFDQKYQSQHHL